MKNEDIEQIKSETLDALIELNSYIEILSAFINEHAGSTPFIHAILIMTKIRELMDIVVKNQEAIFD